MATVIPDKRRHPRIYVEVPTILSNFDEEDSCGVATIRQLGCGGCLVKGLPATSPDRVFKLDFAVGGKFISVASKVLYDVSRSGETLTGMKFLSLPADSLGALEDYIGRRLRFVTPSGNPS